MADVGDITDVGQCFQLHNRCERVLSDNVAFVRTPVGMLQAKNAPLEVARMPV